MLRRTAPRAQAYLLKQASFPAAKSASGAHDSIVWMAPSAKDFKQDTTLSPDSKFVFPAGNVDTGLFDKMEALGFPTTIVVSAQKVDEAFLSAWRAKMPAGERLTLVRRGTSMGSIDLKAAKALGITVTNTPGVNSPHVAKFVFDTLQIAGAVKAGEAPRAVLVGAGSVGRCVADLMASVGVKPTIIEHLSAQEQQLPAAEREQLLESRFGISAENATLGSTLAAALPGATHVAFCCPTDGTPIMDEAMIDTLVAGGSADRKIRIACIARPDAFSVAAIRKLPANVHCQFDYGESILAPVRAQVNEGGDRANIGWSSKAMNSEACKADMDEAVLRLLNPSIPHCITLSEDTASAAPAPADARRLAAIGGPSCWVQSFLHLTEGPADSAVSFFRPTPGHKVRSLWQSSGRQISVREKVTKFIRPVSAMKNVEVTADMMGPLATMGGTFASERLLSDAEHLRLKADVEASLVNYRKINMFLVASGSQPIWRETGRLVIAGAQEKNALFDQVLDWRRQKDMVDTEKEAGAVAYLKDFSGVLFNEGYTAYPLRCGGYVVKDAEDVLLGALKSKFGPRMSVVDSTVQSVTHVHGGAAESFRVSTTDTKVTEAGRLYMSAGATHIVKGGAQAGEFERVARPIEITGHSGIVVQRIGGSQADRIRSAYGDAEGFFASQPGAFMTDDYELTFDSVADDGTGLCIRWRVTGGARVNSPNNAADPHTTLLEPVRRFLLGDVQAEGFHECPRQVGATIREEFVPLGKAGVIAMNWGHLGVSLAGLQPPSKL